MTVEHGIYVYKLNLLIGDLCTHSIQTGKIFLNNKYIYIFYLRLPLADPILTT